MEVLDEDGLEAELDRLRDRYLTEVHERIRMERQGLTSHPIRRLKGQFYLKRCLPGMSQMHPNCVEAVAAGVLDQAFVDQLGLWNFQLIRA